MSVGSLLLQLGSVVALDQIGMAMTLTLCIVSVRTSDLILLSEIAIMTNADQVISID